MSGAARLTLPPSTHLHESKKCAFALGKEYHNSALADRLIAETILQELVSDERRDRDVNAAGYA
jgi:hypothetical protein